MRKLIVAVAALGTGLTVGAAPALADVLVVRSMGNAAQTYPRGRALPDNATVVLRAGDSLTVLGAGGTRTFRGPGRFRLSQAAQANPMASAIGANSRSRVGAVRGTPMPSSGLANPWEVDVTRGGTACVSDPAHVTLWRPDASSSLRLHLSGEGSTTATLEWPAGRSTLDWPDNLPVTSGAEYQLSGAGNATSLRFVTVPGVNDRQETAALFIRNGCDAQLDRLIDAS